jgi:transcription antitermination factor NusG
MHSSDSVWIAIQTAPRHEKRVEARLEYKGYECFLPLYQSVRQWSDRNAKVDLPLFPSYLFCKICPNAHGPMITTPGVVRLVGAGRAPEPISDVEIAAIHKLVSDTTALPCPYLNVGDRVRVTMGPLRGISGILTTIRNQNRLIISVDILMRSISVEISPDHLERLPAIQRPVAR